MNKKFSIYMLISATALSVVFNYFFLYTHWGISVLLFNILLLTASYYILHIRPNFNLKRFLIISLVIVILSLPFMKYDFILFKFLNSPLIILVYGYMFNNCLELNLLSALASSLEGIFSPLFKLHRYLLDIFSNKNSGKLKKGILGLLFASISFIVIIPLLLSSDSVFQAGFNHIFNFIELKNINE